MSDTPIKLNLSWLTGKGASWEKTKHNSEETYTKITTQEQEIASWQDNMTPKVIEEDVSQETSWQEENAKISLQSIKQEVTEESSDTSSTTDSQEKDDVSDAITWWTELWESSSDIEKRENDEDSIPFSTTEDQKWDEEQEDTEENPANKSDSAKKEITFQNYESKFETTSKHLSKHVRKFHYKPKTRWWLILSLLALTAFWVSMLMIFFPEKHSFHVYKASIIEIYEKNTDSKKETIVNNTQNTSIPTTKKDENEWKNNNTPQEKDTSEALSEIQKEEVRRERLKQHLYETYWW